MRMDCITESKKSANIEARKHFALLVNHRNQFVYVIHVILCLLNMLPNQQRRLIQDITEIDTAEKEKKLPCLKMNTEKVP